MGMSIGGIAQPQNLNVIWQGTISPGNTQEVLVSGLAANDGIRMLIAGTSTGAGNMVVELYDGAYKGLNAPTPAGSAAYICDAQFTKDFQVVAVSEAGSSLTYSATNSITMASVSKLRITMHATSTGKQISIIYLKEASTP